jgi:hypothetical protein
MQKKKSITNEKKKLKLNFQCQYNISRLHNPLVTDDTKNSSSSSSDCLQRPFGFGHPQFVAKQCNPHPAVTAL